AAGAPGQVGDPVDGDAGEQALQYGVPPGVGIEVPGAVGAEGGGDEPGVVGAQGVLDERDGVRAGHEVGQGVQDGAAFGGGALGVDPGEGVRIGAGGVQDEDAGGVGVVGPAAAARLGEPELPHRDGAVGARGFGGLLQGPVEPGAGGGGQAVGEPAAQLGGRGGGRVAGAVAGLVVGPVIGPVVGLCCCRGVGGGAAGLRLRRGVGGGGRGGGGRGGACWVCLRGRRDGIGAVHGVVLPSGVAEGSPCEGTGS